MPSQGTGGGSAEHHSRATRGPTRRAFLAAAGVAGATGLSGCISGFGGFGGGDGGPVKIGTAFPYTGVYSESAKRQKDGVDLAVKEINADGGIMDRDVEVVDRDTELNADVAARRVNDLIQNENVDLLVANLSGGISIQTQSLAKNAGVPYMAGCQTIPKFHRKADLGAGSYAAGALNTHCSMATIDYVFEADVGESKTFYGIVADYGWGHSTWEWAKKRIQEKGGEVVGEVAAPVGNQDFSSQISSAKDSGADILFMSNAGVDTANLLKQVDSFNLRESMELVQPNNSNGWATIPGKDVWEGVITGMQWYQGVDDPKIDEWAGKMNDEFGYQGATYASITYNAVKELDWAVSETESFEYETVGSKLSEHQGFSYVKGYEESWRDCDNQLVTEWYTLKGKPVDQMGEQGPWDIFEVVGSYGGEEYLPQCSFYE